MPRNRRNPKRKNRNDSDEEESKIDELEDDRKKGRVSENEDEIYCAVWEPRGYHDRNREEGEDDLFLRATVISLIRLWCESTVPLRMTIYVERANEGARSNFLKFVSSIATDVGIVEDGKKKRDRLKGCGVAVWTTLGSEIGEKSVDRTKIRRSGATKSKILTCTVGTVFSDARRFVRFYREHSASRVPLSIEFMDDVDRIADEGKDSTRGESFFSLWPFLYWCVCVACNLCNHEPDMFTHAYLTKKPVPKEERVLLALSPKPERYDTRDAATARKDTPASEESPVDTPEIEPPRDPSDALKDIVRSEDRVLVCEIGEENFSEYGDVCKKSRSFSCFSRCKTFFYAALFWMCSCLCYCCRCGRKCKGKDRSKYGSKKIDRSYEKAYDRKNFRKMVERLEGDDESDVEDDDGEETPTVRLRALENSCHVTNYDGYFKYATRKTMERWRGSWGFAVLYFFTYVNWVRVSVECRQETSYLYLPSCAIAKSTFFAVYDVPSILNAIFILTAVWASSIFWAVPGRPMIVFSTLLCSLFAPFWVGFAYFALWAAGFWTFTLSNWFLCISSLNFKEIKRRFKRWKCCCCRYRRKYGRKDSIRDDRWKGRSDAEPISKTIFGLVTDAKKGLPEIRKSTEEKTELETTFPLFGPTSETVKVMA
jgi:hypothetical protein